MAGMRWLDDHEPPETREVKKGRGRVSGPGPGAPAKPSLSGGAA